MDRREVYRLEMEQKLKVPDSKTEKLKKRLKTEYQEVTLEDKVPEPSFKTYELKAKDKRRE